MKSSTLLKKTKRLLRDPRKWTTKYYALDRKGLAVSHASPSAVRFCLAGALSRCVGAEMDTFIGVDTESLLVNSLPKKYDNIVQWNDKKGRTHAQVIKLLDKAIAKAKKLEKKVKT